MFDYNDPIIHKKRTGKSDDPFVLKNETLTLNSDGKVDLTELPDPLSRVRVAGEAKDWFEIQNGSPNENQYKVDYTNKLVTFHISNAGKQLNFEYYGRGLTFVPDSIIYTERDESGGIKETLKDLTNSTKLARDTANQTNTDIQNAEALRETAESIREQQEDDRQTNTTAAIGRLDSVTNETRYKDVYSPTAVYKKNNIVYNNGSAYMAKQDTLGNAPTDDPANPYWALISRKGADGNGTVHVHKDTFTATEGQTIFTLSHTYDQFQNRTSVTVGGVPQRTPENYEEASSNTIILNNGVPAGTIVEVKYYSEALPLQTDLQTTVDNHTTEINKFNNQSIYIEDFVATEGQSVFTLQTTYDQLQDKIEVYVEGLLQDSGDNYFESANNQITLSEGVPAGTEVKVRYFGKRLPVVSDVEATLNTHSATLSNHTSELSNHSSELNNVNAQLSERAYQLLANQFNTVGDAITELNVGTKKILFIPDGTYSISSSLTVNGENIDVRLAPNAKIVSTLTNISAFIFTGKNCSLSGGTIEYPASFDGTNRKWQDNEAVVLVKGDGFEAKNVTLKNVYKVGFGIREASDCIISENIIQGNFPAANWTGTQTAHFGIAIDPLVATGGENIIITENIVKGCVQGVFVGSYGELAGYGINISNNVFEGCHNHGIYSNGGIGTVINANSFNRCSLPIAILGKFATITNNNIYTYSTGNNLDLVGISVREASHCDISHNIIKGDAPSGSTIIDLSGLSGDPAPIDTIDNNVVSNNIIEVTGGSVNAIRIGVTNLTVNCFNNQVKNNIIKAVGRLNQGLINISVTSTSTGKDNHITGNTITVLNNCHAIYLYRQKNAIVSGNTIKFEYSATVAETITLLNCFTVEDSLYTQNIIKCESGFGTNISLRGIREDSTSNRNLATGNLVNFESTSLTSKLEIFLNTTSKTVSNMINGVYVA